MKELRQFERFVLDAPAKLYLNKNHFDNPPIIQSVAHDISSGGAFLQIKNNELTQESDIIVEVVLTIDTLQKLYGYPNEVKLKTKANIIRTTYDGIAVSFQGKPVMISNL